MVFLDERLEQHPGPRTVLLHTALGVHAQILLLGSCHTRGHTVRTGYPHCLTHTLTQGNTTIRKNGANPPYIPHPNLSLTCVPLSVLHRAALVSSTACTVHVIVAWRPSFSTSPTIVRCAWSPYRAACSHVQRANQPMTPMTHWHFTPSRFISDRSSPGSCSVGS